ncbi:MAG: dephospho-CoA kinase [Eubacteriales bacterium]
MKRIGITGGIGSGKSTVSKFISSLGYMVIDADKISLDLASPKSELLNELKYEFGEAVINENGSLNRKLLGDIVFSDKEKRKRLDLIFQPRIKNEIERIFSELEERNDVKLAFLDAPLIFETGLQEYLDKVWLISTDTEKRFERIKNRDNLSIDEIKSRIQAQMNDTDKIRLADVIIENNGNLEELKLKIVNLIEKELE